MWALHFLFTMFLWIWRLSCPWVQLWAAYVFSSTRVGAVRRYSYQLKICCFATNNCTGSPNNRPQNTAPFFYAVHEGPPVIPADKNFDALPVVLNLWRERLHLSRVFSDELKSDTWIHSWIQSFLTDLEDQRVFHNNAELIEEIPIGGSYRRRRVV